MQKKELRTIYKEKRNQLSHTQREKLDDLLLIQFQKLELPFLQSLLSYWPMARMNEINTHTVTDFIAFRNPGIQIAYPVSDMTSHEMKAVLADDDTEFNQNEYAIMEPIKGVELAPEEIDAILIPLLAFDKRGHRVGYGKGFYDRFLTKCRKEVIKIGLCYFEPITFISDIDSNDIPIDYCITPENIYMFSH